MVQHLRKQGEQSLDSTGNRCAYRGLRGLKCAVGVLIPEEEYNVEMEHRPIMELVEKSLVPTSLKGLSLDMLVAVQDLHDDLPVNLWEQAFKEVAGRYNLVVPPPEEVTENE